MLAPTHLKHYCTVLRLTRIICTGIEPYHRILTCNAPLAASRTNTYTDNRFANGIENRARYRNWSQGRDHGRNRNRNKKPQAQPKSNIEIGDEIEDELETEIKSATETEIEIEKKSRINPKANSKSRTKTRMKSKVASRSRSSLSVRKDGPKKSFNENAVTPLFQRLTRAIFESSRYQVIKLFYYDEVRIDTSPQRLLRRTTKVSEKQSTSTENISNRAPIEQGIRNKLH